MGSGFTIDGVKIRDATNPDRFAIVTAAGELTVTGEITPQTVAGLSASVVSVTNAQTSLLAANANRIGGVIQNHGASILGVYFTTGTSFTNAPIKLPQYATLDLSQFSAIYKGAVFGIRASATEPAGVIEET